MKKYIKPLVIILCIIFLVTGCKQDQQEPMNDSISVDSQEQVKKMPYQGYFQKRITLSPYEPLYGAYLGAYVLANPAIEFDMTQFEEAVDREMALALRHYQLGDPFPDQWLLECVAQKKAPYIVITPASLIHPYDSRILEETAIEFKNTYGLPVFIEFFPDPKAFGDPKAYSSYFKKAKEVFSKHAPNTVFVWGIDMEDVYDAMVYYPGDAADWVGLRMYISIQPEEGRHVKVDDYLDYFYHMYQDKKPMIISKLAISHYSKKGHSFYVEEAAQMIRDIYGQLPKRYPRIKGVNYVDMDNIKVAPGDTGNDNFSVSTEPKITKAYQQAISDPYYLKDVEESAQGSAYEWMKMRTPIYEWNKELYVLEAMILHDWGISDIKSLAEHKVIIGGSEYYHLESLVKSLNYRYTISDHVCRIYQSH